MTSKIILVFSISLFVTQLFNLSLFSERLLAEATIPGVVRVSTTLNIRSTPGTSSKIIGSFNPGDNVDIIGEQGSWLKIRLNGSTAWVHSKFVEKVNNQSSHNGGSKPDVQYVNVDTSLNVRSSAGTSSNVIGSLGSGEKVEIVGRRKGWLNIRWNGSNAWVSDRYIGSSRNSNSPNSDGAASNVPPSGNQVSLLSLVSNGSNTSSSSSNGDSSSNGSSSSSNGYSTSNGSSSSTNGYSSSHGSSSSFIRHNPSTPSSGSNSYTSPNSSRATGNVPKRRDGTLEVPFRRQYGTYGGVKPKYPNGYCGPTAVKMVLDSYPDLGKNHNVNDIALKKVGPNSPAYKKGSGARIKGMEDMLRHSGLKNSKMSTNNSIADLKRSIDNGNPVIVGVRGYYGLGTSKPGHYLVVIGFKGNSVIVQNPGNQKGERRAISLRTFEKAWKVQNKKAIFCKP